AASAKAARAILAKRLPGKRCARPGVNGISWQPFQVLPALPRFAAGAFLIEVDDARRSHCVGVFARLHILRCYFLDQLKWMHTLRIWTTLPQVTVTGRLIPISKTTLKIVPPTA